MGLDYGTEGIRRCIVGVDLSVTQALNKIQHGSARVSSNGCEITGTTDIEVLSGLTQGDEIVTGSYKVLRTVKPGTSVKIDNSAAKKEESN